MGSLFALDARTGRILWSFSAQFQGQAGGSIETSPAVVDGVVYWGTGGSRGGIVAAPFIQAVTGLPFTLGGGENRNNKVYAFELGPR